MNHQWCCSNWSRHSSRGSRSLWRRLRKSAVLSLVLWTATLVAGTLLVNIA